MPDGDDHGAVSAMVADRERRAEATRILAAAIRACEPEDAVQIMAAALEDLGAGMPSPDLLFGRIREDAAFWADCATPVEIEVFVAEGLRKISRQAFCEAARKRIFATLWESFDDASRRAFLGRVDPSGRFRGKSS
ncbi:hypothetical protein [Paenirhodobacter populi]|uniref:hypothetical protein n=1 Tax=Paenirhodobacter populi TaxID=2306993 RepID=UPI0019D43FBF|nr:hypothetical protein [Sinirhodobacter populi]